MALALDRLQPGAGIPGTVVRTELQADRLRYKSLQAHDLRLDCHWHDRQADLTLAGAQLAGGRVEGPGGIVARPSSHAGDPAAD